MDSSYVKLALNWGMVKTQISWSVLYKRTISTVTVHLLPWESVDVSFIGVFSSFVSSLQPILSILSTYISSILATHAKPSMPIQQVVPARLVSANNLAQLHRLQIISQFNRNKLRQYWRIILLAWPCQTTYAKMLPRFLLSFWRFWGLSRDKHLNATAGPTRLALRLSVRFRLANPSLATRLAFIIPGSPASSSILATCKEEYKHHFPLLATQSLFRIFLH